MNKHSTHSMYLSFFSLQQATDKMAGEDDKMTKNNIQKERP